MMEHFLTHDIFKTGLRIYLNKQQVTLVNLNIENLQHPCSKFGCAETEDMYDALQTAVNDANASHLLGSLTVAEILDTWVNRSGFPIVTVTRNYTTGSITFTQVKIKHKTLLQQKSCEKQFRNLSVRKYLGKLYFNEVLLTFRDYRYVVNNRKFYILSGYTLK